MLVAGLLAASGAALAQGAQPVAAGPQPAHPEAADAARLKSARTIVLRTLGGVSSLDQLDESQRADLLRALDEIETALPGEGGNRTSQRRLRYGNTSSVALECATPAVPESLNDAQKLDLSNALGELRAELLADDQTRLTCHYERKTGTNIVSLHCETVAQREHRARESQELMREIAPTTQLLRR